MKKIGYWFVAAIIVVCLFFSWNYFSNHKIDDHYVITRTNDYPPTVTKISKEYNMYSKNVQFVPIKAYIKIGLEYFCTVEFVDSTYLVNYTNHYLGNFHYEGLRFHIWQLIGVLNDSTYIPTSDIKKWIKDDYIVISDTIYSMGLKVYDIEKYTFEKHIERYDSIYEEGNEEY